MAILGYDAVQPKLKELKDKTTNSYLYWRKNSERWNEFMRFIFDSNLSTDDIIKLQSINKPNIEVNVLEAMINRMMGEFSKHTPSISVHATDSVRIENLTEDYLKMMRFIESYLRFVFTSTSHENWQYKVFRDMLAGGYSVAELYTEYTSHMSFDQQIKVKRVFDPTMTGFDPLARDSHKGDGQYCFQLFPVERKEFERMYGRVPLESVKFQSAGFMDKIGNFNWTYKNMNTEIVMVCEFFEKVHKRERIVKMSNGHVVLAKHYKELLTEWKERGFIEQPPVVIEDRMSNIESIKRYLFCDTAVIDEKMTSYSMFPLVFFDGNSADIKDSNMNSALQSTRPFPFQAKGAQQLMNFAVQTLGNELENLVQHKFIISKEAICDEYQEAYRNVQKADVLVYNAFHKGDVNVPLQGPREVQRTPTPPIVESAFFQMPKIIQQTLGNYDSVLGTNEKDVSGRALQSASIHTSASSGPYFSGFINGCNRIAHIIVDLMPKYVVTPRTLPVVGIDGKKSFQFVNHPDVKESISLSYSPNDFHVEIEAGVNTDIQKMVALEMIAKLSRDNPDFAQFISQFGLEVVLDNLDIRGIEHLKALSVPYMKAKQEAAQAQSQKQDPAMAQIEVEKGLVEVEAMKVEQRKEEAQGKMTVEAAKVALDKQKVDLLAMEVLNDIRTKNAKLQIEQERIDSENARAAIETAIDLGKDLAKERSE